MEGKALHVFQEIADILEFIPEGYEISVGDDGTGHSGDGEEEIDVGEGFDIETDEKIEEDDTMRWDEENEEEEEDAEEDEFGRKRSHR